MIAPCFFAALFAAQIHEPFAFKSRQARNEFNLRGNYLQPAPSLVR